MRLEFDSATHTYRFEGVVVPSVTQIARFCFADMDQSRPWAAAYAADRGSRVHQYCMLMDYGALPDTVDADCAGYLKAYQRFLKDYKPNWSGIEESFGNHQFAGTVDRYGGFDDMPAIVDIKTGQLHQAALEVQLTGYAMLLDAVPNVSLYALQLSKDGTYRLRCVQRNPALFHACVLLHEATQTKGRSK